MGKEDRIKKRIKRKETKLKSLTPKASGGKSSTSSMFTVTNKLPKKGNQGKPNCGKGSGTKGNCPDGNLRAKKSKVAKGKKFSTKGSTNTVGTLQKRKKIQEDIDKLKGKLSKSKKGSPTKKYANPRFL